MKIEVAVNDEYAKKKKGDLLEKIANELLKTHNYEVPPKMWGEGGKEGKDHRKPALKAFLESKQAPLQEQPFLLGAFLLWRRRLQGDRIAQSLQLTHGTGAHAVLIQRLKVGRAEIAVLLVIAQHMVDDHEQTMRDRHDGFGFANAAGQTMILSRQIIVLGMGDDPDHLGQRRS